MFCLTAVAGLGFAVRAGPGPCGQAVLRSLDGQRRSAETDGEADIQGTVQNN